MDVFREYKPIRNKIALLAIEDALSVIWAYAQYLQVDDFHFPRAIEVLDRFLALDVPRQWISEWELELLAKEVILNSGTVSSKGLSLRSWRTLSEYVNMLKDFENRIYGENKFQGSIFVELVRVAHRQFVWQGNPPNSASIIRYYKIFNRRTIDDICMEKIGLTVSQIYMCGVAWLGHFLGSPAMKALFTSDIKGLPVSTLERFLVFTCRPLKELRAKIKDEQQYNANFAYAYSSLRAFPLVRMDYQGSDSIICPIMTLLYWRFTGGLYYDLISDARFGNEFGNGLQQYVGDVISHTCVGRALVKIPEEKYVVGKAEKRTCDWIVAGENSALFLECKSRRLSWGAKASLADLSLLEADLDAMASAVVQLYKTIADYEAGAYPTFPAKDGRKIYPAVVTLENWRMFGPIMLGKLSESVVSKLPDAGLSPDLPEQMPYSVWAVEELEVGLQIMNFVGIAEFMEGKLRDPEMRSWEWTGYMNNRYSKIPKKKLFDKEYDAMFSDLLSSQNMNS